jgi:hypothetical protein
MRIFLLLICLNLFACSINDGINGINGEDGFSIGLISKDVEFCKEFTFFKDLNQDGFFDEDEDIIDSFLICSGENGINGQDGADGTDGVDGTDGEDGADGTDGVDGTDGEDGADGTDGVDGQDGISIGLLITNLGQGCNRLTFFYDVNYNKTLEESEETISVIDLCDGDDGIDGVDGTDGTDGQDTTISSNKVTINGVAQKGPFLNGSSVIISELDSEYSQTGKSFNVQIEDNSGKFNIKNIPLVSSFINTRVDGFYYNEITGKKSNAQITLNGIVDISENKDVNLNVLTHLEKARVEYLLANTSLTFKQAKDKAQEEILSIFEIDKVDVNIESEKMDIASNGEGSKVLLAISSILQGYRTEAEFSSLLADIISDIKADGTVDNQSNKSLLVSHAKLLDPATIRTNVLSRYSELNQTPLILDFSSVITDFYQKTSFTTDDEVFEYPEPPLGDINPLRGQNLDTIYIPSNTFINIMMNSPVENIPITIEFSRTDNENQSLFFGVSTGSVEGWIIDRTNQSKGNDSKITLTSNTQINKAYGNIERSKMHKFQVFVGEGKKLIKTTYVTGGDGHTSGGSGS